MDNFDLKKYLAEGRLFKDVKKVNVQELSSNNVVWNWSGDRNELEQVPPKFKAAVRAGLGNQIDDKDFEDAFDGIKNFFADEAGRGDKTFNSDHWVEMIEMDYLAEGRLYENVLAQKT